MATKNKTTVTVAASIPANSGKEKTGGKVKGKKAAKPIPTGMTGKRGDVKAGGVYVVGSALPGKKVKPMKVYKKMDGDTTFASRSADGSASIAWNGHTLVSILRWMGRNGANVAEAALWMTNAGYPGISKNTLNCQITSGRGWENESGKEKGYNGGFRGNVAEFSKEEKAYWMSIRPETSSDEE